MREVITTRNVGDGHGRTAELSESQFEDLVVFLDSLPSLSEDAARLPVAGSGGLAGESSRSSRGKLTMALVGAAVLFVISAVAHRLIHHGRRRWP